MRFRPALTTDITAIASLHADSWRRYYRAAYADTYLDGDILTDRLKVWTTRLQQPDPGSITIVAEPDPGAVTVAAEPNPAAATIAADLGPGAVTIVAEPGDPAGLGHPVVVGTGGQSGTRHNPSPVIAGFVHVVLDHDERWGSLLDNLHVTSARHRNGLGSELLVRAARATAAQARTTALYLWVQEQNTAAQAFYAAHGGKVVERAPISDPGGVPGRLKGRPMKLRVTWPDARTITRRP
jgi:ribosomal protein S18 acetylase RimI-like enzyme